jgi:hypothetical protein
MATPNYDDIVRNFMGAERFDRALAEQDKLGLPVGAGLRSQGGGGGVVQLPGQGGAPGPYTVDPGAAMSSYFSSFTPELMDQIFKLEQGYGPKFTQLDLDALKQRLTGTMPLIGDTTTEAGRISRGETNLERNFNIDQLNQLGYPTLDAYLKANPYLKSAMDRSDALGGVSTNAAYDALSKNLLGGAPTPQNLTPQTISAGQLQVGGTLTPERVQAERIAAERVASGQVQAGQVGQGDLGQSLYQQALNAQQQSPLSQALQARGLSMATTPGQLSPEEIRAATQGAREGYAGSGRLMDNAAITGEALARAGAARERSMQDIAAAQQINQQLLGASQQGQALATDVLRTDIQRQQANVGNQLQAGQFNVESALRADLANQQTNLTANQANQEAFLRAGLANQQAGMEAGRFNITNLQDVGRFNIGTGLQTSTYNADAANRAMESNRAFNYAANQDYLRNLGLLGNTTAATREADRAYNLNQVGAYGGVTNAALNSVNWNQPPPGVNTGLNYFTTGGNVPSANRFDPNAGVNMAMTNASNLSNYYSSIYGADQARAGAETQAKAAKSAGAMSAAGSVVGAGIGAYALMSL